MIVDVWVLGYVGPSGVCFECVHKYICTSAMHGTFREMFSRLIPTSSHNVNHVQGGEDS